jgi:hypothetical protein
MKTKEEFVARWRCHLAGLALFGVASDQQDGPLKRASKVLEIPAQVEKLLGQMYTDLTAEEPKPRLAVNGDRIARNGA